MIKGLLYLALLTSAVIFSWIGFSVYHSYTTSTITPDQSIVITPVPAEFDEEVLSQIKSKKTVVPNLAQIRADLSIATEATESASAATSSAETNENL